MKEEVCANGVSSTEPSGRLHQGGESIGRGKLKCNIFVPSVTDRNWKEGREETVFKAVGRIGDRELSVNLKRYGREEFEEDR